jgi:hypothetical protein
VREKRKNHGHDAISRWKGGGKGRELHVLNLNYCQNRKEETGFGACLTVLTVHLDVALVGGDHLSGRADAITSDSGMHAA